MTNHTPPPITLENIGAVSRVVTGQVADHPEVLSPFLVPYETESGAGEITLRGFVVAAAVDSEFFPYDAYKNSIAEQLQDDDALAVVMTASGLLVTSLNSTQESPVLSLFPPGIDWHETLWCEFGRQTHTRFQQLLSITQVTKQVLPEIPQLAKGQYYFTPSGERR